MIKQLFALAKSYNTWVPLARNSKLMEEVGEFSEALLFKLGYLPHKTVKEPIEGEAADIIICVVDTLQSVYPDLSPDELTEMLQKQLAKKSEKWKDVMINRAV